MRAACRAVGPSSSTSNRQVPSAAQRWNRLTSFLEARGENCPLSGSGADEVLVSGGVRPRFIKVFNMSPPCDAGSQAARLRPLHHRRRRRRIMLA
jgi:hypothetical protein